MSSKTKALQKSNNLLDRKIRPENRSVFTDMICYIRSADISDYHQELVRYDLIEMILSAQEVKTFIMLLAGILKNFVMK